MRGGWLVAALAVVVSMPSAAADHVHECVGPGDVLCVVNEDGAFGSSDCAQNPERWGTTGAYVTLPDGSRTYVEGHEDCEQVEPGGRTDREWVRVRSSSSYHYVNAEWADDEDGCHRRVDYWYPPIEVGPILVPGQGFYGFINQSCFLTGDPLRTWGHTPP